VVTAAVVTRVPGQETGWHHHDAPLLASMLEGELTVDDGPDGTRSHGAGESPPEAFRSPHDGLNAGDGIVRLMAVSIGAEGVENTVTEPD
jgi:quercetin dioxygenase-like cupin family protein